MWSDAARASSMQARGMGSAPATGGSGGVGPAGNVSGGADATQSRLTQAGAGSRGQWNGGKGAQSGSKGSKGGGSSSKGGGSAHQSGVNSLARNMQAGKPLETLPPAYYPNVASNSYAYGNAGMPGL